jgi:hypothetical protein
MFANHLKREFMKLSALRLIVFMAALATCVCAVAQNAASTSKEKETDTSKGFSEIESIQGTLNSSERLFKLDSTLGWDFNNHFGVFAGLPVYLVQVPSSTNTVGTTATTTSESSNNGIGNIYFGLAFRAPNPTVSFASTLTAGAPTGNRKKGFSSGRGTIDWDNRLEHSFDLLTPFFEGGLGNTVPDSRLFTRPFTSLGFVAHLEEGAELDLFWHLSIGGSAYEIVPAGNQQIFSKLVAKGGAATGAGKHGRVFETGSTASGDGLTRENGFNAWIGIEPNPIWRLELGYTRSMTFDLNSFAFNLQMNVGKILRSKKTT